MNSLMLYFFLGLALCVTTVLGSHFRGAIFMVRPSPGGAENAFTLQYPFAALRAPYILVLHDNYLSSGVIASSYVCVLHYSIPQGLFAAAKQILFAAAQ